MSLEVKERGDEQKRCLLCKEKEVSGCGSLKRPNTTGSFENLTLTQVVYFETNPVGKGPQNALVSSILTESEVIL